MSASDAQAFGVHVHTIIQKERNLSFWIPIPKTIPTAGQRVAAVDVSHGAPRGIWAGPHLFDGEVHLGPGVRCPENVTDIEAVAGRRGPMGRFGAAQGRCPGDASNGHQPMIPVAP